MGAWSHPPTQPITAGLGAVMGAGSGRAALAAGAAAGHARKRTTSASGPQGAKYDTGTKGSNREAKDVCDYECLMAEDQAWRDAAWCVMM